MVYFNEEKHIYYVNGIQVPSVTGLLHFIYPNKYKGVSSEVLSNKADYGTKMHSVLEQINNDKITDPFQAYSYECPNQDTVVNYINLKNKHGINPLKQELIVYNDYVAGKYDLFAEMNNKKCLMDYKTTYELDKNYLSWQLSIYNFLNQEDKAEELYAIWIPKNGNVDLVQIDFKSDEEVKKLIIDYYLQIKDKVIKL